MALLESRIPSVLGHIEINHRGHRAHQAKFRGSSR